MIIEKTSQQASLIASAIDEFTLETIKTGLHAKLLSWDGDPIYKRDGYIIFTDVIRGAYQLRIVANGFQPSLYQLELPLLDDLFFDCAGENELIVVARSVDHTTREVSFDTLKYVRSIPKGSGVVSHNFFAQLDADLEGASVSKLKLTSTFGLMSSSILRIIRGKQLRLKPDPYYKFPPSTTLLTGKVVYQSHPDIAIENAEISITEIVSSTIEPIVLEEIKGPDETFGVRIATATFGGEKFALGTEKDVKVISNHEGDFIFRFKNDLFFDFITVETKLSGFKTKIDAIEIQPSNRNHFVIELERD